jgi:hypothetical protein
MLLQSHPHSTPNANHSPPRRRPTDQAWLFIKAIANRFLTAEESDRPAILVTLESRYPGVVVTKLVEEIVRRVASGKAKPSVLAVFESRVLLAFFAIFLQTRRAEKQLRILQAVTHVIPVLDQDAKTALMCELMFWSRSAVNGSVIDKLNEVLDSVRLALQVDGESIVRENCSMAGINCSIQILDYRVAASV